MIRATMMVWLTLALLLAGCAEFSEQGRATMRWSLDEQEKMIGLLSSIGLITPQQQSDFLRRIGSARVELQRDESKATVDRWLDVGLSIVGTILTLKGAKPAARGVAKIGGLVRKAVTKTPGGPA